MRLLYVQTQISVIATQRNSEEDGNLNIYNEADNCQGVRHVPPQAGTFSPCWQANRKSSFIQRLLTEQQVRAKGTSQIKRLGKARL